MSSDVQQALADAVLRLLKPLIRVLLQHGISYGAFAEIARRAFVDVAANDFRIEGRKQSVSRISIITGLTRKEVQKLLSLEADPDSSKVDQYNRSARVISGWIRDERFTNKRGSPASLPFDEGETSFAELVRAYSGDMPPRALLDELLRVGAVEKTKEGKIRLVTRAYLPGAGEAEKMEILGTDVSELIATIDFNLENPPEIARFQRKVSYDNIPDDALPAIRKYSGARAQKLLETLDKKLSEADRDLNKTVDGSGANRVSIGIYYFEESIDHEDESKA